MSLARSISLDNLSRTLPHLKTFVLNPARIILVFITPHVLSRNVRKWEKKGEE